MEIDKMTREELEKFKSKLQEDLEEVEEERLFILSQNGIHLSGGERKRYEAEVESLRRKLEDVAAALDKLL